jgi:hypothetical protein
MLAGPEPSGPCSRLVSQTLGAWHPTSKAATTTTPSLVKLGLVQLGLVKLGLVKLGLVKLGLVKLGLVKLGLVQC